MTSVCGNGILEPGEECDGDSCCEAGTCMFKSTAYCSYQYYILEKEGTKKLATNECCDNKCKPTGTNLCYNGKGFCTNGACQLGGQDPNKNSGTGTWCKYGNLLPCRKEPTKPGDSLDREWHGRSFLSFPPPPPPALFFFRHFFFTDVMTINAIFSLLLFVGIFSLFFPLILCYTPQLAESPVRTIQTQRNVPHLSLITVSSTQNFQKGPSAATHRLPSVSMVCVRQQQIPRVQVGEVAHRTQPQRTPSP